MSGANLSHEYFTNRQDRTWIFKNVPSLANFYCDLIHVISKFCYSLRPDASLVTNRNDILSTNSSSFRQEFHDSLCNFLRNKHLDSSSSSSSSSSRSMMNSMNDTYIIPLLQYGHCNIHYEKEFLQYLFHYLTSFYHESFKLYLASGYFNLTKLYEKLIVNLLNSTRKNTTYITNSSTIDVVCASPLANGFLNSKGASSYIPLAYREALIKLLELLFHTDVNHHNVNIYEYTRPKWTFHAKGLWIESIHNDMKLVEMNKKNILPYSLSLIGSSNFSYRSLNRDLESQLCIITTNENLRQCIHDEICHIFSTTYCYPVTLSQLMHQTQYRLPWYCRFILPVFRWYM
ncbi:putative CDP-diacylglycerol--glycerol-3-phosphate 3-phosphatidyltransferase [Schistosoma japonicum]|uniref:CDP-diacylglycerol--glycerol-3-phosphate 3-phosphatidyltransferase n=1 Tax=Schistosoma japonicum TaxID=6182 RepID=A0A4Z2DPF4_SCHJA|nr:putative CDP-diacylglycerol--glycerol-3-phosphate 3-phosphatidyltransferase [Schistosoma japonicum]